MKSRSNQAGFSVVEVAIVVLVLGLIVFIGYTFYNNQMNKSSGGTSQTNSQSATADDVQSSPAINSVADLEKAEATLDQTDPSSSNNSDAGQLDSELSHF